MYIWRITAGYHYNVEILCYGYIGKMVERLYTNCLISNQNTQDPHTNIGKDLLWITMIYECEYSV